MEDLAALKNVFEDIYENNAWGKGSGPGSAPQNTVEYRLLLERFMRANDVKTVTDLGCGDWQFSRYVDWSGCSYIGFDIVPKLIERNNAEFGRPGIEFRLMTGIDDLPGGDLLIAKEVLQHLPERDVQAYLAFIRSKYRFALLNNSVLPSLHLNHDIQAGACRPLKLNLSPYFAVGAVVLQYGFLADGVYYGNDVFLMMGN